MRFRVSHVPQYVLFFCVCLNAIAGAQGNDVFLTLEITGSADGQGYRAKTLAIQQAQYAALQQVIGRLAPDFDEKILRPIFRNAREYLGGYEILRHELVRGRTEVDLKVQIREQLLRQDTAIFLLPRIHDKPTILLLIGEQLPGDKVMGVVDYGVVEVTLTEELEKQGFDEVLGVETLNGLYTQKELIETVLGGVDVGRSFARQQVADVVVIGHVVAVVEQQQGGEGALKRLKSVLDLQVYRSMDGRMLETSQTVGIVTGQSVADAAEEAMIDAGFKATHPVIVAGALAKLDAPKEQGVLITLEQPGSQAPYSSVVHRLRTDPRSVLVEDVFYSARLGRIRVHYEGGVGDLVKVLESGLYDGKHGYVTQAVGNSITLTLRD